MFRKIIESVTTLSGSSRLDAKYLGGRIARRCTIALELNGDEDFRRMGTQALSMRNRVEDEKNCKPSECRLILDALIQLEKDAVLLEVKHDLRNRVTKVIKQENQPKQFFLEGREIGLTPKEYGHMAVEFSLSHAKAMVENLIAFPHEQDATSLIYQISKRQDLAVAHLMAIGTSAYIAYVEMFIAIPDDLRREIGVGTKEGFERLQGNTNFLVKLTATYFKSILSDLKMGGPAHPAGTDTHRTFIRLLSRAYAGREDIDDLEGLDSLTLAPFTNNYYLTIIKDIRDTARLRFAHR